MERFAIVVDGTDTPIRAETAGFALGPIRQPRRPLAGLAIAVVTAIVTMGAVGPRPPETGGPIAAACAPASEAPVVGDFERTAPEAALASPVPWWLLPQMAEWVDPATGRSMQARADRAWRVIHDRHLSR